MNFIRGFVRKGRGVNAAQDDPESQAVQNERSLCVQHLRKLFLEFLHPPAPLTMEQQELKQYLMLPLFLKAFSGTDPMHLSEKFADVLQFAGHMSKLMVTEVQRRAANKTKAQASKDILLYLCHYEDDIDNRGWNLMNVLLFLTNSEMAVVECMVAASLQSILVKCIKLFFSLPENFGSNEKCTEIQRVLVPILIRLCNHPITAKELIRTDDLASLFEALTLSCKPNHVIWRSGVSEIITSITRHCFTSDVVDYIYEKSCINLCLANIEHIYEKDPLAVVEMFVTLTCVLKDSADASPILVDSFHDCQGYKFLTRILLTFSTRDDEHAHEAGRNLVLLVASLVMTGYSQINPSSAISTPFQQTEYTIPKPSNTQGVSIRNLDAFKVLMNVFLQSNNESMCLSIINSIQNLLNYDSANYFIIEPIHPFAQFIQKMPEKSPPVRAAILKLVEFVAMQLLWVPSQELVAMTILFKNPDYKSSQCSVLNFLILLINHNNKYKNILRQAGLIDVMVLALQRYSTAMKSTSNDYFAIEEEILSPETINHDDEETTDYIFLLMECLRLLIENNSKNSTLFREHGGSKCAHDLVPFKESRPYALRIIEQLIVDDGHDDLGTLLGLMHSTPVTDIKLKADVLSALIKIFDRNPEIRSAFQEVGGFVYVVSVLVSLEGSLGDPPVPLWAECDVEGILELVWKTFHVLTSAMKDEPVNKVIFMDEIRFKGLIDTVKLLGCFPSSYKHLPVYEPQVKPPSGNKPPLKAKLSSVLDVETPIVERNSRKYYQMVIAKTILSMATGTFDNWEVVCVKEEKEGSPSHRRISRIYHPTAVNGLIEILPLLCDQKEKDKKQGYSDVLLYIVYQVQHLMGSEINQQLMCDAGLPFLLLEKCEEAFINENHPLNAPLTKLFERLAAQSLHPKVLRSFLRLGSPLCSKSPYAVLRAVSDKDQPKESPEVDGGDKPHHHHHQKVHGKISLTYFNGDIQLTEDNSSSRSETPVLLEENEFQTAEDGCSEKGSDGVKSPDTQSRDSLEQADEENVDKQTSYDEPSTVSDLNDVEPDDEVTHEIDGDSFSKPRTSSGSSNTLKIDEKPSLRKRVSSFSLTDSLSSSYNAVNKVESMLDDELDLNLLDASFHDMKEEITRICDRFEGRPLPQNLVKSVVSLTTPRDVLSTSPLQPPAFVEFSMAEDGYACLFVPSLSPQHIPLSTSHSYRSTATAAAAATLALSTTSASERTFPPQTGLTYSGWVFLEVLPAVPSHMSSVGLLTVEKHWEDLQTKRLVNSSILQIYFDLQSRCLVINTDDHHVNERGSAKGHTLLKVEDENLFEMHRWNHVCVVLNKSMMRNSTGNVYINGILVKNSKMKYIHQGIPTGADVSTLKTVAYIGTHPKQHHFSDLVWRLGPMALIEEPLVEESVKLIFSLGPGYIGCFQAPCVTDLYEEDGLRPKLSALVMEEKLLLSFNPHNVTVTTLLKLSAQCAKSDLALLASEMGISSEDKHTPIRLLPNSGLHLNGASRPIGLFFVGTAGIRIFCPNPVADAFVSIGGMSILLCLVAMVSELSELYASLKALTCILQSSRTARKEMDRVAGYQILAFLLKKKKQLLNTHILHLVFSLVGTVRSDRESASIPNITAFNDLLCDLEIWHNTPSDLERSLFSHFYELITQGQDQHRNIQCLRKLGCVSRLIHVVQDGEISDATLNTVASVLSVLLCKTTQHHDLVVFGQYLASTLPNGTSEQHVILDKIYEGESNEETRALQTTINQRNALLDVIIHLLLETCTSGKMNTQFCEQLYKTLGFDWLLLFLGRHVHKATVIRGIRILCRMLSDSTALNKFQSGAANGHWLVGSEALTSKKPNIAAGFNVPESESDAATKSEHEVNHQSYKQKGIPLLTYLLEEHTDLDEIYFLLFALLIKTNESGMQIGLRLNIETLYHAFWPPAPADRIRQDKLVQVYCLETMNIMLHMVRKMMSEPVVNVNSEKSHVIKTPKCIIEFLEFLYQNVPEIYTYCLTPEFLSFLSATLFPLEEDKDVLEYNVEVISETDGGLPTDKAGLSDHPCKKQVIEFMTTIVIDTIQLYTGKISAFTDVILQSYPVTSSSNQQKQYQTELITAIIMEFMKGKTWTSMKCSASDTNLLKYLVNGVSFAGKVVDKLWMGCYLDSYKTVLQFIIHLIENLEDQSSTNVNLEPLYHTLNRVLLYQFSKPASRITDQTNLLELLHVLSTNSKIIFSSNNYDPEFIACLTHWLLVVGLQESARKNSRQIYSDLDISTEDLAKDLDQDDQHGLLKLITGAAERVWNIFYIHKRETIDEVFGTQQQSSFVSYQPVPITTPGRRAAIELHQAKETLGDQAAKSWITFIGNEERRKNELLAGPIARPTPTSKKISSRFAKSLKREKVPEEVFTIQETLDWITVHLKAVKALIHMKHSKYTQEILLRNHLAEKNWSNMELELISEGGIWGPENQNPLEKWMLDDVEGPSRMRKRLARNDQFYTHYPYIEQDRDVLLTKHRLAFSHDSKLLFQFCQKYTNPNETFPEFTLPPKDKPFSWRPQLYSLDGFEAEDSVEEVNTQTIIQLLEAGEKIFSMYRCARVRGLDSAEGLFLFGRNHFYVIDGFTLMSAETKKGSVNGGKEIKDIGTLPEGSHEPLIPVAKGNNILKRSFFKWDFDVIKEVHKRRYLLQDVAIEVFSNDGSNHLLVFPKKSARDKVYDRINRVSPALISSQESVAGMSSDTDVEQIGAGIFSGLLSGERSVTQKWVRGEITNFQYLMFLNTLAGRSYNDLMQYPIFPWVLRDYTSQFLDLTNESTFRDFSKPMGGQGANRLENYRKRFKEWEDPTGKTPAYYYGTHYSSAMIVASYLIRVEPFTQHFLRLQGGHFDLPDRLFHSVKDSWTSASESNMADIKELIPEFFYLPDFLLNNNKFDLGTKQNGEELGDVKLPPWAKGDAIEFIRLHREALECDYVSAHLHEWIDLVFGYKQQGPAAVEADNVFHHLFYEKSVDLDEITDPLERKATIGFINNFGQMPKQLFKKQHPSKRVMRSQDPTSAQTGTLPSTHYLTYNDKLFFHHLSSLVPSVQPVKELKNAVGQISTAERTLAATEVNRAIFPGSLNRIGWGYGDFSLRYFSSDEKLLAVFEGVFTGQIMCAACLDSNRFVAGGSSSAINVWQVEQTKDRNYNLLLIKVLYGHQGDVLSVAVSKAYNMIVSGSEDKSCIIWDLRKFTYTRRLSIRAGGPVSCIAINNTTGDIVTCAGTHLYVWTVNGQLLVKENTSAAISGQILCCVLSEFNEWDEQNVIITGSADGLVKMWGIQFHDANELEPKLESISLGTSPPNSGGGSFIKTPRSSSVDDKEYLLVDYPNFANRIWKRKLILQHKLTMHTAYSRPDNTEPAAVTALAISKDHRKVFVGDSRGRIYSWSLSDSVGRIMDHWVKDEVADVCSNCNVKFTFSERKHHCRNCGHVFCGKCSRYESPIVNLRIFKAVRVCVNCYHELKRKPSVSIKSKSNSPVS